MLLHSFGCSFLDGTELGADKNSWPKIIASELDLPFKNFARGGIGNLAILDSLLKNASRHHPCICLINWTWIDRFDFCSSQTEKWETLRPSLDHPMGDFYFRNFHGQYTDMLTNLVYIKTAIDYLNGEKIKFIMTYMDETIFSNVWDSWQHAAGLSRLQRMIFPYLKTFEGDTFLNWSRKNNHEISSTLHPLGSAHQAAAEYWLPHVKELL